MSDIHIHVGGSSKSPVDDKPKSETAVKPAQPKGSGASVPPGPQTQLSPLEEALFPHWMHANGVDPEDTEDHHFDYRGAYKNTNGAIHPPGTLGKVADRYNKIQSTQIEPIRQLLNMLHGTS